MSNQIYVRNRKVLNELKEIVEHEYLGVDQDSRIIHGIFGTLYRFKNNIINNPKQDQENNFSLPTWDNLFMLFLHCLKKTQSIVEGIGKTTFSADNLCLLYRHFPAPYHDLLILCVAIHQRLLHPSHTKGQFLQNYTFLVQLLAMIDGQCLQNYLNYLQHNILHLPPDPMTENVLIV